MIGGAGCLPLCSYVAVVWLRAGYDQKSSELRNTILNVRQYSGSTQAVLSLFRDNTSCPTNTQHPHKHAVPPINTNAPANAEGPKKRVQKKKRQRCPGTESSRPTHGFIVPAAPLKPENGLRQH